MRITLPVAWSGGTLLFGNGSAAAPSIAFASDTNTGLFRVAEDTVGLSLGGVSQYQFATTGFTLIGTNSQAGGYLSVTGTNGGLSLTALGTNQNITLTPSGTGRVEMVYGGSGNVSGLRVGNTSASVIIGATASNVVSINTQSSASPLTFALNAEVGRFAPTSGSLLLGTATDSSNGRIQLATHTTSAGGIGFGTDTTIFRAAAGVLRFGGTQTTASFDMGTAGYVEWANASGGASGIRLLSSGSIEMRSNGTLALTLDSSQNATFAGQLRVTNAVTPASASASGTVGTIAWDASYFYVCTASNTWRRVAHATW